MRKLLILVVLVLVIWFSYTAIVQGVSYRMISIEKYDFIEKRSGELNNSVIDLKDKTTTEYDIKKGVLDNSVKRYKASKKEFEELAESQKELAATSVDLVDIDFLWTIIGNYATENDVLLQLDVKESVAKKAETTTYLLCDLHFKTIGNYTDVTKFVYDIEDDDRLEFEINNFDMIKHEVNVTSSKNMTTEQVEEERKKQENWVDAEFVVKGVPMNIVSISEISTPDLENAIDEINAVLSNQTN